MSRWEQFEIWAEKSGKWEMVGAFHDPQVASAVARNYGYRMRLVHATYDGAQRVKEEVLAELGSTRQEP